MLKAERISCSDPKLSDAQTRNFEAIKHTRCSRVKGRSHKWQCTRCSRQFSVTAGTAMRGTKLPLVKWFLSAYLMTHSKRGVSAIELARHLGVSERTAGYVLLRLRGAMARSESVQAA